MVMIFRRRRDPPARTPVQDAAERLTQQAKDLQAAVAALNRKHPEGGQSEQRHKPA